MATEHPFAVYLKTIGRGPTLSRPLTRDEARAAMTLILQGRAESMQVGAFLLLLRYRGETAAELAGLIEAARAFVGAPAPAPAVDLDWPSYADRHRQQPWFVLAALLLARNGATVLMHGIKGANGDGYAPTRPALAALGIEPSPSLAAAAARIAAHGFAYVGLENLCPPLAPLFDMRPMLGVRTAVNTFARGLNPLDARCQVQSVVHPPYLKLHQETALLLGQPRAVVFKGVGGEVQRNPLKSCRVLWVADGGAGDDTWPATAAGEWVWRDEPLGPERVAALWRGELSLPVPEAAIVATAAIALHALGRTASLSEAEAMAAEMWKARRA